MNLIALAAAIAVAAVSLALFVRERRALRAARSALQRRENELAHAARLAAAGELSASIAHEINQPLGAILANADAAELLLAQPQVPLEELRQALADIRADDVRAHEVIGRVRALLERHDTERRELDLHAALDDAIKLVSGEARRRRIAIVPAFGAIDSTVRGDAVQLQQVVLNLLLNAMDAMSDTPATRRLVSVVTRDGGACIELVVSDRGHGFSAAQAQRLFDSYYTTKPHGMGLGLSIARSIVGAHGGRIEAAPRPGGGADFTVLLPARASRMPSAVQGMSSTSRPAPPARSTALA
jgi:C4-dicarboxylate-specific signal transduction histidine kinase